LRSSRNVVFFTIVLTPPLWIGGPAAQETPQTIALVNANVIDGVSEHQIRLATVIVRNGKIASVATGSSDTPADATVVDLKGIWLLPGLIDAHVHFADVAAARGALSSGVITARTGGSIDRFLDVELRDLHRAGIENLPDVVAAGLPITRLPHATFFLVFPKMTDLMRGVRT
jgi:imidazolonepropionase-like amidohydrolase